MVIYVKLTEHRNSTIDRSERAKTMVNFAVNFVVLGTMTVIGGNKKMLQATSRGKSQSAVI